MRDYDEEVDRLLREEDSRALQHAEQLRLAPHERRFVAAAITLGTIVGLLMAIAALWILRSAR